MKRAALALLVTASLSACALLTGPTPTPTLFIPPTATLIPMATSTPIPSPTPTPTPITYTVQPGDTLTRIASQFGVTADAICAFNDLADCSRIYPGQELLIPGEGVVLPSPTGAAPTPTLPAPSPQATPEAPLSTPTQEAASLPPPDDMGPVSAGGNAQVEINNDTPYELTVELEGPASHTVTIEKCQECKVYSIVGPITKPPGRPKATFQLPPGTYQVTARVDAPNVLRYVGTWELEGDRLYESLLYIVTQFQ